LFASEGGRVHETQRTFMVPIPDMGKANELYDEQITDWLPEQPVVYRTRLDERNLRFMAPPQSRESLLWFPT
jgi:hypothetical protein